MPPRKRAAVRLPDLLKQKLDKAGTTRGAKPAEIYQNRVTRASTVLIDWKYWDICRTPDDGSDKYENGIIVLVSPDWYAETTGADKELAEQGLRIGTNALLLFRQRSEWTRYARVRAAGKFPNGQPFIAATQRIAPLGGTYMSRIAATVVEPEVEEAFDTSQLRGAGIRVYEYSSKANIAATKLQLEALVWKCRDVETAMIEAGMTSNDVAIRSQQTILAATNAGLLDIERLIQARILDQTEETMCPLCLKPLSATDFMRRSEQAEGREVHDLTITKVSLFHIQELRMGKLQHKPYNLGWGHHFCNVVVKDEGIGPTIQWMRDVLENQASLAGGSVDAAIMSVEEAVEG